MKPHQITLEAFSEMKKILFYTIFSGAFFSCNGNKGNDKLPIPKHLQKILVPIRSANSETEVHGTIKCSCGSENFIVNFYGDQIDDPEVNGIQVKEFHDGFLVMVSAKCMACSKEHVIFDSDHHGWDSWVNESNTGNQKRPQLEEWHCNTCGKSDHLLEVGIQSEGKENWKSEMGDHSDSDDWKEAFGWITVGIQCNSCKEHNPEWLSYETM